MKCAYCGKHFRITASGWGYAYNELYTCSYKCMRAMEREDGMTEQQKHDTEKLLAEGYTTDDIANKLSISRSSIGGYISAKERKKKAEAAKAEEIQSQPAVSDDVRLAVVKLIQDMLDVLKKVYGL